MDLQQTSKLTKGIEWFGGNISELPMFDSKSTHRLPSTLAGIACLLGVSAVASAQSESPAPAADAAPADSPVADDGQRTAPLGSKDGHWANGLQVLAGAATNSEHAPTASSASEADPRVELTKPSDGRGAAGDGGVESAGHVGPKPVNGNGPERDAPTRACGGGDLRTCVLLAFQYLEGDRVARNEERAAALFGKACTGGLASACEYLAFQYEDGVGVAKDEHRAALLFRMACDGDDAEACEFLGFHCRDGVGIVKDERRAAFLFEKACNEGLPHACYSLALQYVAGAGVAKSASLAARLFKDACQGKVMRACEQLGLSFWAIP